MSKKPGQNLIHMKINRGKMVKSLAWVKLKRQKGPQWKGIRFNNKRAVQ
jgi:hypothetical protein